MEREPTSLQDAVVYFSDPVNCRDYLGARRWPNGVECPTCGCKDVAFLANQNRWWCPNKHPKQQFSLKTGTIYEESPLGLDKWLTATWLVTNCKNGVSSCEVGRALNITQKTAWFMDHRIRFSLGMGPGNKLSGQVKRTKRTSAGRPATCTRTSGPRRLPARVARIKRRGWGSWNAGQKGAGARAG